MVNDERGREPTADIVAGWVLAAIFGSLSTIAGLGFCLYALGAPASAGVGFATLVWPFVAVQYYTMLRRLFR